jgi:hypothetical protein
MDGARSLAALKGVTLADDAYQAARVRMRWRS